MIQETKGMFLNVPSPYQLTMNYCSHACHYCFANLNKPDRSFDEKKTINQLMNYRTQKNMTAEFLRRKYPIMASNLVDVFSKNNHKHFLEVYKIINKDNIPLLFQTRGGYGVDEVLKTLPKSYWYISLTSHDDDLIKAIEPNAPKPSERIELIKKLHALGHKIEIGINPYMKEFCDIEKIMQLTRKYTQFYWLNGLHVNNNQAKNLSLKAEKIITPIIKKSEIQKQDELDFAFETMVEYGVIPSGTAFYSIVDRTELFSVYENKLPIINDFILNIIDTKNENDYIFFEDFFNFYKDKFPNWLNKFDSGYLVAVKREYSNLQSAYTLEEILRFHWNNYMLAESSIFGRSLCFYPEENLDINGNAIIKYLKKPFIHK